MFLTVDDIDVAYGHARILHDVSMSVDQGEMVFIVGRNGAGKTTLLKTIAGFLTPIKGTILLQNNRITGLSPEELSRKGFRYVFQDKRVFTKLTVKENIQLAAYTSGERLDEAIEKVVNIYPKIAQFLNSPAGGLSGGQRQLLLLGRALIGSPSLLLIDEPTEGLAAGIIEDVFRILESMKGRFPLLIVEQNLGAVTRLADRVYAMKEGRISAELKSKSEIEDRAVLENYL